MLPLKSLFYVAVTSSASRTVGVEEYTVPDKETEALFSGKSEITYRDFLNYYDGGKDVEVPQELATKLVGYLLEYGPIEDYVYITRPDPNAKP